MPHQPPVMDFLPDSLPDVAPGDTSQPGYSYDVLEFPWDQQAHGWNFDFAITAQAQSIGNEVATVPEPPMHTSSNLTTISDHAQGYMEHVNNPFPTSTVPLNPASHMGPPARPRKRKAATLCADDWAPYKERVLELHITHGLPLREVKQKIEEEFGFKAELRQYRTRISQWGNDKNIKSQEMAAIVRKRQRRKLVDTNKGELVFKVRGCHVAPHKIERWMKRNEVVESALYAPSEAADTPSDVGCHTISERGSPAMMSVCSPSISVFSPRGISIAIESEQMPSPAPSSVSSITPQRNNAFSGQSPALKYQTLANFDSTSASAINMPVHGRLRYKQEEEERLREELHGITTSTVINPSESSVRSDTSDKLLKLSKVLYEQGRYKSAEDVVRALLENYKGELSDREEIEKLNALDVLGMILREQGLYTESERLCRRVLERRETLLGPEHLDTLTSADSLGSALSYLERHEEAERLHQRVLRGREKLLGLEHPDTLVTVHGLGYTFYKLGRYREAEVMLRRALEGKERVLDPEDTSILVSINGLGKVLFKLRRYDEAEAMLRRDLRESERLLGPEHPGTLITTSDLGNLLLERERYDEAEAMFRRDLEGSEKVLGPEHPNTLISVDSVARVLLHFGQYKEAEAMFRRVIHISKKVLGMEHPRTLIRIHGLGLFLSERGLYEEAEVMIRQAFEGRERTLGPEHPDTLDNARDLHLVLLDVGRRDEAEATHQRLEGSKEAPR